MANLINYISDTDIEKMTIIFDIAGESIGQRFESRILQLQANGMSEKAIIELIITDFESDGSIFNSILNQFKSTVESEVEGIIQDKHIESKKGLFTWLTTSGNPCVECNPRHGQEKTYKEWENEGLPGSGFSRCGHYCMCVLMNSEFVPKDFGEAVEVPPIKEVREKFIKRWKEDPALIAIYGEYKKGVK